MTRVRTHGRVPEYLSLHSDSGRLSAGHGGLLGRLGQGIASKRCLRGPKTVSNKSALFIRLIELGATAIASKRLKPLPGGWIVA